MIVPLLVTALFPVLLSAQPTPPPAAVASLCRSVTDNDAHTVQSLRGQYRVIGTRANQPFTGTLVVDGREGAGQVTISGLRNGKPTQGSARYVVCGADDVRQLEVTLKANGATHTLFCVPHNDFDNFNRLSCSSRLSDPNGDLELWQEKYVP